MTPHHCKLLKREDVAEGTMAFHFEKPGGFSFTPGQCADLTLESPPETDAEGNTRTFSIASPPSESSLMFATRMRNTAFKRVLRTAPLGTRVSLEGPMGSFVLHRDAAKPAVFLAGGIGITPFLSILRQAAREREPRDLYLFYSNRRPRDAAFLDAVRELAASRPELHVIPTMTDTGDSAASWAGETGHIDLDMLRRHAPDLHAPVYYVAGPPGMVLAMRQMLAGAGVEQGAIRSDEFMGY